MRFFVTCRWLFLLVIISCLIPIFVHISKPPFKQQQQQQHTLLPNNVEVLLEQLFHPLTTLTDVQLCWNNLMNIWKRILLKFLRDACVLCHNNVYVQCYQSVDINLYLNYINKTFYPFDEDKRPFGMGLYHDFDLKLIRSLNNSILSTDVSPCDYFHMFQLMIHVQTVLHKKQIKYFMTKGTFIGSLRHHDVIPWDTDIDLFIPRSAAFTFKYSFNQLNPFLDMLDNNTTDTLYDEPLYQKDLVLYQYRNVHKVTSYKIFSIHSSRVNQTHYRWPKIDVFPYQESRTHIFAFPRHKHNLGTMNYLSKLDVEPIHLRPLGPLLIPSPQHLQRSLKAMVLLGGSNVFVVCEGNSFLHRQNRQATDKWRVPCQTLSSSYPFVKSDRNSTNNICTEMLIFSGKNNSLSLFKYKCDENLARTLE